jgi:hypothetical protein
VKLKEVILCTIGASVLVLAGGSTSPASAQTAPAGSSPALQRWDSASEISFPGTINEVVTEHAPNVPAGVNLLIDGTTSFQYANLGSQLNSSLKSELTPGQAVTLKGIVRSIDGQNFLIVRQLTIGQQTTQIRNTHGMLSPRVEAGAYQGNRPRGKSATAGGGQ